MNKIRKILAKSLLAFTVIFGVSVVLVWQYPHSIVNLMSKRSSYQPVPITGLVTECFEQTIPLPFSYCINSHHGDSERVIYHFHGRKGTEFWWNDDTYYTGELYRQWSAQGNTSPTVISISLGPLWLFNDKKLNAFFEQIMPIVESKIAHKITTRFIVGESMGGVNALTVWASHLSSFDGVAALCPPLPTISPYANVNDLGRYLTNSTTSLQRGLMLLLMGRSLFESTEDWERVDALQVISNRQLFSASPLYLSCGAQDQWGCMAGSTQLIDAAIRKGHVINWHPREGGHCDIDEKSLAKFLMLSIPVNIF